jgi:hypothetical protein
MPLLISKRELLDSSEGGARVFIDERLWSSAEFAAAVTAWLAHRSVYRDRDWPQATRVRSPLRPIDRAVAAPPS